MEDVVWLTVNVVLVDNCHRIRPTCQVSTGNCPSWQLCWYPEIQRTHLAAKVDRCLTKNMANVGLVILYGQFLGKNFW